MISVKIMLCLIFRIIQLLETLDLQSTVRYIVSIIVILTLSLHVLLFYIEDCYNCFHAIKTVGEI